MDRLRGFFPFDRGVAGEQDADWLCGSLPVVLSDAMETTGL